MHLRVLSLCLASYLTIVQSSDNSVLIENNIDLTQSLPSTLEHNNSATNPTHFPFTIPEEETTTVVGAFYYSSTEQLILTSEPENQTDQPIEYPVYNCTDRVCVRKCCKRNSLLDKSKGCVDNAYYNTTDWEPEFRDVQKSKLEIIYGFPGLPPEEKYANYVCGIHESFEFHLKDDGKVHHKARGDSFNHNFYCMEKYFDEGKLDVMGAICYEKPTKSEFSKTASKIHLAGMAISTIFLFAILILHLISPTKKDLQIKCTISSCINLFFGFILAIINMSPVVKLMQNDMCVALGVSVQFFFLSFYFWLNVMCYEILRIIRGTMNLKSYKDLTRSEKRYFVYCFYSWGSPLLICLITIVMQYLPKDAFPEVVQPYIIRPHIAEGRCWFKESVGSVYAYYYGIEVFLHFVNACFMGYTMDLLYREKLMSMFGNQRGLSTPLRTHSSKNYLQMFKQQLMIYLMYLLIWILNAISLIKSHAEFWRVTDIIVSLQGVFLFFIVIRPRKYFLLMQAYEKMSDIVREVSSKVSGKRGMALKECSSTQGEETRL